MGEKMKAVEKFRFENAQKWANYSGPMTPEKIAEMKSDNDKLEKMAKEATREWLQEKQGKRKKG